MFNSASSHKILAYDLIMVLLLQKLIVIKYTHRTVPGVVCLD